VASPADTHTAGYRGETLPNQLTTFVASVLLTGLETSRFLKGILSFNEGEFHAQVAAALQVGSVAIRRLMIEEGIVIVDLLDVLRSGKGCNGGVEALDSRQVPAALLVDGWDFGEERLNVGSTGKVDHAAEVGDGSGRINAKEGVVGAAQEDDGAEVPIWNLVGKAGEHLRSRLAVDAEICPREGPALGDGIAHERNAGVGMVDQWEEQDEGEQDDGEFEQGTHSSVSTIIAG
jgi:hypothetical protein